MTYIIRSCMRTARISILLISGFALCGCERVPRWELYPNQAYLGRHPAGRLIKHTINFVNSSDAELTIEKLSASCGCILPRLESRVLQPGEQVSIPVTIETERKTVGSYSMTLSIHTSDQVYPVADAVMDFDIGTGPTASPEALFLLTPVSAESRQTIQVQTDLDLGYEVRRIVSRDGSIRVVTPDLPSRLVPGSPLQFDLRMSKIGRLTRQTDVIMIELTDRDGYQSALTVPVYVAFERGADR